MKRVVSIQVNRKTAPLHLEIENVAGHKLYTDAGPSEGGQEQGFRPMELILAGLASCSTIDIVLILQKQKLEIEDIKVEVHGTRADAVPAVYEDIQLVYHLKGELPPEKVRRAIDLSLEKYCSVSAMIDKVANITASFTINETEYS